MSKLCDVVADSVTLSATAADGTEVKVELPVIRPTLGPPVIDVTRLNALTGMFTFDPGFTGTSSCQSSITFIDGPKGQLLHRGYSIEDLASKSSFLEVCFLLLNNELPRSRREFKAFEREILRRMIVHERLKAFMTGFPDGAHPMAVLVGTVGALSAFYHKGDVKVMDDHARALAALRVVAKMPTIAAMSYKQSIGQPFVYPRIDLSYSCNFLRMMFKHPFEDDYLPPEVYCKTMDVLFLLHADHEQNASTSTVRLAGSSDANPFACVAAGVASLWGPSHGGANEAVIIMLREIGSKDRIPLFLAKAKDKADPFKLMGFGHRVYRNFDPRARQMKVLARECIEECFRQHDAAEREGAWKTSDVPIGAVPSESSGSSPGELRQLLELATALEAAALADDYFASRKLFPNVDFYSGLALTAMGIPLSMFTVIFAIGRSVGWITQWKESIEEPVRKIGRPRQLYVGEAPRPYTTFEERELGDLAPPPSAPEAHRSDSFTGQVTPAAGSSLPAASEDQSPYSYFS